MKLEAVPIHQVKVQKLKAFEPFIYSLSTIMIFPMPKKPLALSFLKFAINQPIRNQPGRASGIIR
ncbi:hypothetical protein AM501_08200 [Aneurinibacillus migulanus]|nr:hypothetical protein TS64_27025 [Aneurinibacillus migulanus]KPD08764.1 hypothetical protein AM501_08200 [Aneurinibacillus migulanus]